MTTAVAQIMRRLAERRLAEIRAEAQELETALREMGDALPPGWSQQRQCDVREPAAAPVTNGAAPAAESTVEAPTKFQQRLETLQESHGPVFFIQPPHPAEPGQKIKYGNPPRKVEVLEEATRVTDSGKTHRGYFAKVVE